MTATLNNTSIEVVHPGADEVFITGDFNHWNVPGVRMTQTDRGTWTASRRIGLLACVAFARGRVIQFMTPGTGSTAEARLAPSRIQTHD